MRRGTGAKGARRARGGAAARAAAWGAILAFAAAGCGPEPPFDGGTVPDPDPGMLPCPTVGITGVSPGSVANGQPATIAIRGSGFNNGATVEIVGHAAACGDAPAAVSGVTVVSPSLITATFTPAVPGGHTVRVTRGGVDACVATAQLRDAVFAGVPSSGTFFAAAAGNVPDFGLTFDGVEPGHLVAADFDCDCRLDAIVGVRGNSNVYVHGGPDSDGDGVVNFTIGGGVGSGRTDELAAADMDGDGDLDVLYADGEMGMGGVHLLTNMGDCSGTFADTVLWDDVEASDLAVGDLDGDSLPDVAIVADARLGGAVLFNEGGGSFRAVGVGSVAPKALVTSGAHDVAVADLNGDGLGDIADGAAISQDTGAPLGLILRNAGGGFADVSEACGFGPELLGVTHVVGAGDLDGDGDTDLVWGAGTSFVALNRASALGASACAFDRTDVPLAGDVSQQTVLVDVDLDGDLDVWNGSDAFLENNGSGTLAPTFGTAIPAVATVVTHGVALADLDGDGKLDLLAMRSAAPYLFLFVQQ